MEILPLTTKFNTPDNFREQIAVLYYGGFKNGEVRFVRSWVRVCQPAMAGFDVDNPGEPTFESWQWIDDKIENANVIGIFHTHPIGCFHFSEHDTSSQKAFAMTYGKRILWHGVQACGSEFAHFKCMSMKGGHVFVYDYGNIRTNLEDAVILLPAPPVITHDENVHTIYGDK